MIVNLMVTGLRYANLINKYLTVGIDAEIWRPEINIGYAVKVQYIDTQK